MVEIVVKLGGRMLIYPEYFDAALDAIGAASRERRLLVVPGGGLFADAVRDADRRFHLSDDAAHWMAILAMDQYAYLVAERLAGSALVQEQGDIVAALDAGHVPVLAPSRWLRQADPLPHTWDVTGDSIAAWVAGEVKASRLVLVKPPGSLEVESVDAYFHRALPAHVMPMSIPADQRDALYSALRG